MRIHIRLALLAALAASAAFASSAGAEGWPLDGRAAPDLVLPAGMNGVTAGTTLSSLRGKVVYLKFWLRDCPICRGTLPSLQETWAQWGGRGLFVLTIVHQWGPNDPVLRQFLSDHGYTFPVGTDADGSLAARYGVNHRPVDYLIGVDGRVKSSNGVPGDVLGKELGFYRLHQLGNTPDSLKGVRDAVWQYRLGAALKDSAAAAAAPDATADVKAVAGRVQSLAEEDLAGRTSWIQWLRSQQRDFRGELDDAVREYTGTSLQAKAEALRKSLIGG
jgi:peroxiredoxin